MAHKVDFHASAHDARGHSLPEKIWRDMHVYADLPTLEKAREWADNVIVSDSRVEYVSIRESIQEFSGGMWKAGPYVETVHRPDATV